MPLSRSNLNVYNMCAVCTYAIYLNDDAFNWAENTIAVLHMGGAHMN